MHRCLGKLMLGFALLIALNPHAIAVSFVGDTTPKQSVRALIQALQHGGYVIYFRHGITGKRGNKNVSIDQMADCTIQRNLSQEGIVQTKAIGNVFDKLSIPIGEVYSSPYCRCMDTAKNIFGKVERNDNLYYAMQLTKLDRQFVTEGLLKLLAAVPKQGTNTALVSHTANLREATGIWPKPEGVAHVFKPAGDGTFSYVGMVLPDEWIKFMQ